MKRWIGLLLAGVVLLGGLVGCGTSGKPFPEGMDKAKVEEIAKNALTIMNNKDYEALSALFPEGAVAAEKWEQSLKPLFEKFGTFKEFGKVQLMGDEQDGVQYAVALVECKYEKGKGIFSVSINTDYQVMGLWLVG